MYYYRESLAPDTLSWLSRLAAAGGSASDSTIEAVETFARTIDAAGIRSVFTRLNLFCGSNLASALVPLYTGPTVGALVGTRAVDSNVNGNFVGGPDGDFANAFGILGNQSNKALLTGVTTEHLGTTRSCGVYLSAFVATAFRNLMGSTRGVNIDQFGVFVRDDGVRFQNTAFSFYGTTITLAGPGMFAGASIGDSQVVFANGLSATYSTSAPALNDTELAIFATNRLGTLVDYSGCGLSGYYIGTNPTVANLQTLYSAWRTFHLTLGRPA